jgi:4F5 protein related disordered region
MDYSSPEFVRNLAASACGGWGAAAHAATRRVVEVLLFVLHALTPQAQRELARERNAKNAPKQTQHDKDGLTVAQRKARCDLMSNCVVPVVLARRWLASRSRPSRASRLAGRASGGCADGWARQCLSASTSFRLYLPAAVTYPPGCSLQ